MLNALYCSCTVKRMKHLFWSKASRVNKIKYLSMTNLGNGKNRNQ
jgi:hypothetical protein